MLGLTLNHVSKRGPRTMVRTKLQVLLPAMVTPCHQESLEVIRPCCCIIYKLSVETLSLTISVIYIFWIIQWCSLSELFGSESVNCTLSNGAETALAILSSGPRSSFPNGVKILPRILLPFFLNFLVSVSETPKSQTSHPAWCCGEWSRGTLTS